MQFWYGTLRAKLETASIFYVKITVAKPVQYDNGINNNVCTDKHTWGFDISLEFTNTVKTCKCFCRLRESATKWLDPIC